MRRPTASSSRFIAARRRATPIARAARRLRMAARDRHGAIAGEVDEESRALAAPFGGGFRRSRADCSQSPSALRQRRRPRRCSTPWRTPPASRRSGGTSAAASTSSPKVRARRCSPPCASTARRPRAPGKSRAACARRATCGLCLSSIRRAWARPLQFRSGRWPMRRRVRAGCGSSARTVRSNVSASSQRRSTSPGGTAADGRALRVDTLNCCRSRSAVTGWCATTRPTLPAS